MLLPAIVCAFFIWYQKDQKEAEKCQSLDV